MKLSDENFLPFLKNDIKTIRNDDYHPRHCDLMNMLFYEEIPSLIEFAEKVQYLLNNQPTAVTGEYSKGYYQAFEDLKRWLE